MKPVKCTVIGDFSVGKTSVIYSYLGKNINNVQTTLGIEFFTKSLKIKGEDMILTIWDTAGAERFQSLTDSYLRNSDVIIIPLLVFWVIKTTLRAQILKICKIYCFHGHGKISKSSPDTEVVETEILSDIFLEDV